MMKRSVSQHGFSLIELLVSMSIMLAVTAGIFTVMNPSQGTFQSQPEVADVQQRLRVGVDTLYKDLLVAGAGSYAGSQSGTLAGFIASVLPYLQSGNAAVDDGELRFRSDGFTLFYVPPTTAQTTIRFPMPDVSAELQVEDDPGCPPGENLCGFKEGMTIILYDETGAFDTMTITEVQDPAMHLQHNQQGVLSKSYDAGAKVAQINQHVYFLNTETNQLMHADGSLADGGVPVVDNVVDLEFQYWGEPQPPSLRQPGDPDRHMTYGPRPPLLGNAIPGWPAGENCVITLAGVAPAVQQVPRLATLGPPAGGLVRLNDPADPNTSLTDGPWCPEPGANNRWDADLLRIRKISVKLRVQSAVEALRGQDALLFRNPGNPGPTSQLVPDQEIRFDVTPRNLNLGR